MKGYITLAYMSYVMQWSIFLAGHPGDRKRVPSKEFNEWISGRELLNSDQVHSAVDAFRKAASYEMEVLLSLDEKILGTWDSGYGSGTTIYSSVSERRYTFNKDHTFYYSAENATMTWLPPVSNSPAFPSPPVTGGTASTFYEHGIFIISGPTEILLISDRGRCSFNKVEICEGLLTGDFGTYRRS